MSPRPDLRTSAWQRRRARQLAEHPACVVCGSTELLEADHVVPVAAGGSPDGPLQTLCRTHNRRKGTAPDVPAVVPVASVYARRRRSRPYLVQRDAAEPGRRPHAYPFHHCMTPTGTVLRGDMSLPRWTGTGCPPGCPLRTTEGATA